MKAIAIWNLKVLERLYGYRWEHFVPRLDGRVEINNTEIQIFSRIQSGTKIYFEKQTFRTLSIECNLLKF